MDNEVKITVTSEDATDGGFRSAEAKGKSFGSRLKDMLTRSGAEGGTGFGLSFVQRAGPLVAKAPVGPAMIAAVGAAAPAITATLTTAITTGAALGAVGLGAAISARDPAVQAAGKDLGAFLTSQLTQSARPFVPAMLRNIAVVKAEFRTVRPELDAIFSKASTYLDPLTRGATGFVQNAVPGFRKVVDAAEPLVEILGEELPELGEDFAGMLEDIAESAARNEDEFRAILDTVGLLTTQLGSVVTLMDYLAAGPTRTFLDLLKGSDEGVDGILMTQGAVEDVADAMSTATDATRSFREEMQKLIDTSIDSEQANIDFQAAIDAVSESIKENGKSLDVNTEKGRANRQSLLDLGKAGLEYADAIYEEQAALGDVAAAEAAAEAAYQRSRAALVRQAGQFFKTKAEAEAYVTEILGIPPTRNTRADFNGDNEGVRNWKRTLSGIPREIFTSARLRAIVDIEVRREQATQATGRAHGGLTGSAQTGGVRADVTMVGEYGREIVDLPPGAHVYSNPDTERMLAGGSGGISGVLEVRPRPGADTPLMNKIIEGLIFTINTEGESNPQQFLSGGRSK
jgi:hypothetical protein